MDTIFMSELLALREFSTEFSNLGQDYVYARFTERDRKLPLSKGPFRIDGLTWILCRRGKMTLDVNVTTCQLPDDSLLVAGPGTILSFKSIDWDDVDMSLFFVSADFMRDTNLDPNVISAIPYGEHHAGPSPMLVSADEALLLQHYFELIHRNVMQNSDEMFVRSISRNLVSAMTAQVIQFATRRTETDRDKAGAQAPRSRRLAYVKDFLNLVQTYHNKERSIHFYAEKLFVSAKYLSCLIKEHTGRSAAQWVDEFVILEAKNMLRYSDKSIQQVSYALNFKSQSSFGKFFKHMTGMSPTEYQKS